MEEEWLSKFGSKVKNGLLAQGITDAQLLVFVEENELKHFETDWELSFKEKLEFRLVINELKKSSSQMKVYFTYCNLFNFSDH